MAASTSPHPLRIISFSISPGITKSAKRQPNLNPNFNNLLHSPTTISTDRWKPTKLDSSRALPSFHSSIYHTPLRRRTNHTSMDSSSATDESIMAALVRLNPQPLYSLSAELRLRQRRLSFLLLSPPHFSLALSHLRSLSLTSKTLLLARFLLRSLYLLQSPVQRPHRLCLRDFDAAVLLLAMCDSYDPSAAVPSIDWRSLIADRLARAALCPAGLGGGWWPVIAPHVDAAVKCRRLVEAVKDTSETGGAAAAAVMSLAIAEIGDCAICGEEIGDGGAMPCGHPFHWGCILEWLRMRNTCPCCRFELPTANIYGEIERVWKVIIKMGASSF